VIAADEATAFEVRVGDNAPSTSASLVPNTVCKLLQSPWQGSSTPSAAAAVVAFACDALSSSGTVQGRYITMQRVNAAAAEALCEYEITPSLLPTGEGCYGGGCSSKLKAESAVRS
jgi:hypothetical protein